MPSKSSPIIMHAVGVVAFIMIGAATGILYVVIVGNILGRGREGFGLAAAIFMFPVLACTSSLLCWLPVWLLHRYRVGRMSPSRALLLGAIVGLLLAIVIAGPSGFTMRGGSTLINYFVIVMIALGAVVHNWAASRP